MTLTPREQEEAKKARWFNDSTWGKVGIGL
jgi:hypothetical protein